MSVLTKIAVPFAWSDTSDVYWTRGTPAVIDLAARLANPDQYPITYSATGLPAGVTIAGASLSYDGAGAAASAAVTLGASSGVTATATVYVSIAEPTVIDSPTHVVYSNGAGGTHATIAAAIAAMGAGDTLELRNATAGATTVWAQVMDLTGK